MQNTPKKKRLSDYALTIESFLSYALGAGAQRLELDLLQEAEPYLDLAGEDIRSRLLTTLSADGVELCLRPEFTIPATQYLIEQELNQAFFVCSGMVYRQRSGKSVDVLQVGFEHFGGIDTFEADARVLGLTIQCLQNYCFDFETRIGEATLFKVVADQFGAPKGWLRQWRKLKQQPQKSRTKVGSSQGQALVKALRTLPAQDVEAYVQDLLRLKGAGMIGHRSAAEIAERFIDTNDAKDFDEDKAMALHTLLSTLSAFEVPLEGAADAMGDFAKQHGLDLSDMQKILNTRYNTLKAAGLADFEFIFSARFERPMDYYTGLMFTVRQKDMEKPLASGGRYDTLASLLGSQVDVPAVGAVIWLERLNQGSQA